MLCGCSQFVHLSIAEDTVCNSKASRPELLHELRMRLLLLLLLLLLLVVLMLLLLLLLLLLVVLMLLLLLLLLPKRCRRRKCECLVGIMRAVAHEQVHSRS